MLVSVHAREAVCALQSLRPGKRQKSAEFFRITDFLLRERAIAARKFRDADGSAGGDDPARDRRPRCTGYGADRNRQDAGIFDSRDGTAHVGKGAWGDRAGAWAYARTCDARGQSG